MTLWNNHLLMNAVIAWITAQVLKVIIYALVNRRLDIRRLFGDGGMPSGHSATVTALAVTAGLECGLDSAAFAVSAILAIIVMHDAMGVRLEAGKHAKALNELLELASSDLENEVKLKEFVGHTPLQVAFGCLLGLVLAVILS
ncbi:hypothetical protein SDC9_147371 [bioreactor metagenome]|uniref:Divergent PAP2 family protein n=1 Tax=bioreactor metagenome TaxID=1076179 RepID=A0A645EEI1_9ZZZZ|nr:divergent PAP2 family protein [Oscillibacter sp.]MEA4992562.1 divergent PAP2 family protein [Oscillibacter sp.]